MATYFSICFRGHVEQAGSEQVPKRKDQQVDGGIRITDLTSTLD